MNLFLPVAVNATPDADPVAPLLAKIRSTKSTKMAPELTRTYDAPDVPPSIVARPKSP